MSSKTPNGIELFESFLKKYKVAKGETVEETVNNALEFLSSHSLNESVGSNPKSRFYDELISACALILNGTGRIHDPVRIYRNLSSAFARRGYCIFEKRTVARAIKRVQAAAMDQGKGKEIVSVWRKSKNELFKKILSSSLPVDFLLEVADSHRSLATHDYKYSRFAAEALCANSRFPIQKALKFISFCAPEIVFDATRGICQRKNLPEWVIVQLFKSEDKGIRSGVETGLGERNNFSKSIVKKIEKLKFIDNSMKSKIILRAIREGLIPSSTVSHIGELPPPKIAPEENMKNPLKHISGSKKNRTKLMLDRTLNLRTKRG